MPEKTSLTDFDIITLNPLTQIVKAIVPYLEPSTQRTVSLMIRFMELKQTISFFGQPQFYDSFNKQCRCACHDKIHSFSEILSNDSIINDILNYCPENYSAMINTYRQFSKMSDIMNLMNLVPAPSTDDASDNTHHDKDLSGNPYDNNSFGGNIYNSIPSGLLNSEQQSMYQHYMEQLNNINFDER